LPLPLKTTVPHATPHNSGTKVVKKRLPTTSRRKKITPLPNLARAIRSKNLITPSTLQKSHTSPPPKKT
jgi:hypothetical protein